jgi:predicted nucleic acid-binding protein
MRALLDVNVVIALLDPDHAFHERAHGWFFTNV